MKAFRFNLEQALRWRETQMQLQSAKVAAATANLARLKAAIGQRQADLSAARLDAARTSESTALAVFAAYPARAAARIRELETQAAAAAKQRDSELAKLVEATRNVRLLEKLKESDFSLWRRDFDRELSQFADETFQTRNRRT